MPESLPPSLALHTASERAPYTRDNFSNIAAVEITHIGKGTKERKRPLTSRRIVWVLVWMTPERLSSIGASNLPG